MRVVFTKKFIATILLVSITAITNINAQIAEWRLANVVYSAVDPDAGGPAVGSVTFTLQIHATAGTINDITGMSTGWSWQNANAMLPTGPSPIPTCGTNSVSQPSNVVMSPTFAGWTFNNVNQCSGTVNYSTGGQTFDRRSVGTVDGGTINLTTTWVDVFTVTMWSRNASGLYAGYVVINSGNGGTPGAFSTYAIADGSANEYIVNSLTYLTPLALAPSAVTPVTWKDYKVTCSDKGTIVAWSTTSETNSSHYEVEKYVNGTWKVIGTVNGAGNTDIDQDYRYLDLEGGVAQYRVRQVDFDGRFEYTAIRSVSCEDKNISVVIFPVPTRDQLNVAVRTDKAIRTTFEIYDMSGRVVKRHAVNLTVGSNSIPLNVGHLSSGEYIIRSTDGTLKLNQKFTIVR